MKAGRSIRTVFLIVFALFAIMGLSAFRSGSSKPPGSSHQHLDVSVRSVLPKLEILSITSIAPGTVEYLVRNGYDKDITAVVTRLSDSARTTHFMRRDYIYAGLEERQKLPAGKTDNFFYSPDPPGKEIVIVGVLFSDLTREGALDQIEGLLEVRRGVKMQLARINPQTQRLSATSESLMEDRVQRLRQLIENLPIQADDGLPMSSDLEHGLRTGQTFLLSDLSKVEKELRSETQVFYSRDGEAITENGQVRFRRQAKWFEDYFKSMERRL